MTGLKELWARISPEALWGLGAAGAYLLGSIPFGYVLVRVLKGEDVRKFGSGNIGATNAARRLGWWSFPVVLGLDAAKGAGAVFFGFAMARWFPCDH